MSLGPYHQATVANHEFGAGNFVASLEGRKNFFGKRFAFGAEIALRKIIHTGDFSLFTRCGNRQRGLWKNHLRLVRTFHELLNDLAATFGLALETLLAL